jgi:hypothetical protein
MPRLMAVALTVPQVRGRSKTVTRRDGWLMLGPGDPLTLCEKARGRKNGELLVRIADVQVVSVRREPLDAITPQDVAAEGFPDMTPEEFVSFFTGTHKGCEPGTVVTRYPVGLPRLPHITTRQRRRVLMTQWPVRQRIRSMLAWGVDLHDESGKVHQSLAGKDLLLPLVDQPALDAVVAVEQDGWEFDGNLLVIKRTCTDPAGRRLEEIPAEAVTPPTEAEVAAVNQALDYLGYTGPREIRLLLALDHT